MISSYRFQRVMAIPLMDGLIKIFDLGHFSFNRNKTQTAVTNICLKCITFINLTFRMLQHTSSEVIIIQLQINLNSKYNCTDWELTKLIDIKRQEYPNNRDKVSHCQRFHLGLA